MAENYKGYLFEVSWEVCNKVGGIYTVISSKIREAMRYFGDRYFLLGPDLKTNVDFEESDDDFWIKIREQAAIKDIPCRFGYWRTYGKPKVILVDFSKKYNKDQLLYQLWERYGIDSISGGWDYIEPVMFSYACGEVIETIYHLLVKPEGLPSIAHFHEWMSGAGLLCIKSKVPEMGTVFTTHATILGRTLASSGMDLYANMANISPRREASVNHIAAKYSMETATAREADCFTAVSEMTALEAKNFLGRYPDVITPNGLDIDLIPNLTKNREPAMKARGKLLEAASQFLKKEFSPNAKIMAISGRYEFRNKGIDVFLNTLGRLDKEMNPGESIIAYLFILAGHMDLVPSLQPDYSRPETGNPPIATHRLHFESSDSVLETCNRLGLKNAEQNRVNIIFIPTYLNGHDGLLNIPYYDALAGCDIGVFPSYYEPWGYTPLESIAHAVPTITTDQAGFGLWIEHTIGINDSVIVLKRRDRSTEDIENQLYQTLKNVLSWGTSEMESRKINAQFVSLTADWGDFFKSYLKAYDIALDTASSRVAKLSLTEYRVETKYTFTGAVSTQPHFRSFTAITSLPENIKRLRELAYNLWWTWNPRTLDLFAYLDPKLWTEMDNNPVRMLESLSPEIMKEASKNKSYLSLYRQTLKQFDEYIDGKSPSKLQASDDIRWSSPIVYFSMEYGFHESMPLYSGGLGVLSADHLKTASDLSIPFVGIGLLYKNGYFKQVIDKNGLQTAEYPENDFSKMSVQIVRDDQGNEVQISVELPGRTLFANIWEIKVGRVSLFLLNSDVPKNTLQDRVITQRLYTADRKTRLEQEVLLGIGGIRLLKKLGIKPKVFHINEGHSAFLLFERISALMSEGGLSFDEAKEVVRGSTIFTSHTPVEAGNERFERDLMEHYFSHFVKLSGITWSQFWELGQKESGEDKPFYMTILALKLSHKSNAVSRIHGQVARHMWHDVWKGFDDNDIPIQFITNGVHTMTYMATMMKELFDGYLGLDWSRNLINPELWEKMNDIPDTPLWRIRYELKQKTLNFLRDEVSKNWAKYGYSRPSQEDFFSKLNPSALLIGFARRFAPYKRADLILSDLERLDKIVNHKTRPAHIIFAGKAHPNDEMGRSLIKRIMDVCKEERFRGKIFFIEDYDMRTARRLLQGVDVWLNTPRRPYEACGTSGIKALANGVLNLSVSDGWWAEAWDGTNGWTIGPPTKNCSEDIPSADDLDRQSLFTLLENTVIPMFYDRNESGLPEKWIQMIKRSMYTLIPKFNTERMLLEYYHGMYLPTAQRGAALTKDSYKLAKDLADWKRKMPMRFFSLRLLEISVEGVYGDTIFVNEPLIVKASIDPGKMEPNEILVELQIGQKNDHEFMETPEYIPLKMTDKAKDGTLTFAAEYTVRQNGAYNYGIRVLPYRKDLSCKAEAGLILWG